MEEVRSEFVTLDVGGTLFKTTLTTLRQYPESNMLAAMFNPESGTPPALQDANGAYLIDRNPKAFAAILNYLRTGELFESYDGITMGEVLSEARYFGLQGLVDKVRSLSPGHQHKHVILLYYVDGIIKDDA